MVDIGRRGGMEKHWETDLQAYVCAGLVTYNGLRWEGPTLIPRAIPQARSPGLKEKEQAEHFSLSLTPLCFLAALHSSRHAFSTVVGGPHPQTVSWGKPFLRLLSVRCFVAAWRKTTTAPHQDHLDYSEHLAIPWEF